MPRELVDKAEFFSPNAIDSEIPVADFVAVIWQESNGDLFRAQHPPHLRTEEILETLVGTPIPSSDIYPLWFDGLTKVSPPLPGNVFVKKPNLLGYDGSTRISEVHLKEVTLMEELAQHPHRGIVQYLGCIQVDGRIAGICLWKYVCTLKDVVLECLPPDQCVLYNLCLSRLFIRVIFCRLPPYDPEAVLCDVREGLNHLHSLGLVHDDLNPLNIMLDEQGHTVIIDLISVVPQENLLWVAHLAGQHSLKLEQLKMMKQYSSSSRLSSMGRYQICLLTYGTHWQKGQ